MKKSFKRIGAFIMTFAMVASIMPAIAKADAPGNYSYFDDYTLGWSGGIVAFQNGRQTSLSAAGAKVYDRESDRPFKSELNQAWDTPNLVLTAPVQFTTNDGKVHDVESMLTGWDFIADPTAIDNSDVDGKLYVYGTTEGFTYNGGTMANNAYRNHSLSILSTEDMVNWTDEGFMDSQNLTNLPSDAAGKTQGRFTSGQSWAPSGLKKDGDDDGDDEYYLFFTNGGSVGYVMGDSPTGPWRDPLGRALFTQGSPNCSGVVWCFDPGVLCDDKGDAYVYFGGGTTDNKAHGKTGRVCKIQFAPGTGEVSMDGTPQVMDTYYFFEDSEINQFNGLYYYSYCANFNVPGGDKWTKSGSIAVYVCSDPMKDIAFDPAGANGDKYTDGDGVYHHYLGTVLDNPSVIYGESYNNHHHMQEFKGHFYIIYHSTVLSNSIFRTNHQYRNLHVDEIQIDEETDDISITPTYDGAQQIEAFNPYADFQGNLREINATTTSYSAGVKSLRSDVRVKADESPMVLDEIDTGDWTKIQGADFGSKGAVKVEASVLSNTEDGAIEVFVDDPTVASNMVASMPLQKTSSSAFETISADVDASKISGVHDVYFVFRGTGYNVAAWKFTEGDKDVAPAQATATPAPQNNVTPAPVVTPKTGYNVAAWKFTEGDKDVAPVPQNNATPAPQNNNATPAPVVTPKTEDVVGGVNYAINADGTVTAKAPADKNAKSVVIPDSVTIDGKAYPVAAIADRAFSGCKALTSVTIGKNVKKIGKKAFYGCSKLKKILVKGTKLKSVGKQALKGTAAKLKIKVPKKKLKAYKKLFKGKGQGKKAKVTK